MVRAPDGTIRFWNKGAEDMYGWRPEESMGKSSHALLNTEFPKPLPSIEQELLETGHWEGDLVHTRRDGTKLVVRSRWELRRDGQDEAPAVIEINTGSQASESLRQGGESDGIDIGRCGDVGDVDRIGNLSNQHVGGERSRQERNATSDEIHMGL